ncbi:hypothetical protein FIV49_15315 [Cylindrospermopsis raciborskii GIHE 2018]|nr:hypothetical protein FIV49_15315 [Cylindrospermopsis raciborskii GIHE 2018]
MLQPNLRSLQLSRVVWGAQLFVGGNETHGGVGFHASTQPTFITTIKGSMGRRNYCWGNETHGGVVSCFNPTYVHYNYQG